jgi:hypothetical protein
MVPQQMRAQAESYASLAARLQAQPQMAGLELVVTSTLRVGRLSTAVVVL